MPTRKTMQDEIRKLKAEKQKLIEECAAQLLDATAARSALQGINRLVGETLGLLVQSIQLKIERLVETGMREEAGGKPEKAKAELSLFDEEADLLMDRDTAASGLGKQTDSNGMSITRGRT